MGREMSPEERAEFERLHRLIHSREFHRDVRLPLLGSLPTDVLISMFGTDEVTEESFPVLPGDAEE